MKKGPEIPQAAVWGTLAVVLIVLGIFAYSKFMKPVEQVDISKISPERLSDPDPRSPEGQKLKEQMGRGQ